MVVLLHGRARALATALIAACWLAGAGHARAAPAAPAAAKSPTTSPVAPPAVPVTSADRTPAAPAPSPDGGATGAPAILQIAPAQLDSLGVRFAPVERVQAGSLAAIGRVVAPPSDQAVVAAPAQGIVVSIEAAVGDRVRAGQVLARFSSPQLIETARALAEARSQAALAQAALERDTALLRDGIIPAARVEATRARANEARMAVQARQAELESAGVHANGSRFELVAPIAGLVLEAPAEVGARTDANAVLFRVARTDRLQIDAVAAFATPAIAPGARVSIAGRDAAGQVAGVAPAREGTPAQRLRVTLERPGDLRIGETVTLAIESQAAQSASSRVASRALFLWQGRWRVFVRRDAGVAAVPVTVVTADADGATIADGPASDEKVAISGIAALKGLLVGGE